MLYAADFETTTQPDDCRVWAAGIRGIDNDTWVYGNSIEWFIDWCKAQGKCTLYFHNLKFDGEFIMNYLFRAGFQHILTRRELESNTFTTLISDKGQFYSMEICFYRNGKDRVQTTIYDSLKIIPFSVNAVAKSFGLSISKLTIDYNEVREIGHELTQQEIDYLHNDVDIMSQALKTLFSQGLNHMTQGSNALADYKAIVSLKNFNKWFPTPAYDSDIRQSYKGGFTYSDERFRGQDLGEGIVLDVNSLYPSIMYYQPLPYGEGIYFTGQYKEDKLYNLYVQSFTCQFELKPNHLPTIQLKNSLSFIPTEYVKSSNGEDVTMCMTSIDLELFLSHYEVYNIKYHSGWKFKSAVGLFRDYIDKWVDTKIESEKEGNMGMRTLAKLMLNSLYGKFALNPAVRGKIPYLDEGIVKYKLGEPETREPIYIPVGTFITAGARYKTISSAQKVYDRFLYADTDSLHLLGKEIPKDLEVDKYKLGAWKHESTFSRARFIRAKTYIEEIDGKLHITCAGMPERCYEYVTWDNFKPGGVFDGKLQMKHVPGGIILKDINFTIKK